MSDIKKKNGKDRIEKDKRLKVSPFKIIAYGLKTTFRVMPVFFIIINIVGILHGVSHGFVVFVTQGFYDSVAETITNGTPVNQIFLMIAAVGLTLIIKDLLNGLHNFMHEVMFSKMGGEMTKIIHGKMAKIEPVCLEDTKMHDDINKASEGAGTVTFIVLIGATIFTFYIPYFIFMGFYLHSLKPQFVLAIVMVFIPVLLSQIIRTGIIAKFTDEGAPVWRQYDYYRNRAITDKEYFKETRILGAFDFFINRMLIKLKELGKIEFRKQKRVNMLELVLNLISSVGYAGILYMLFTSLLAGEITVGAFAAVFSSIGMLFAIMKEIINSHIGNIASNMGKAQNFIRFMEMPEREGIDIAPDYTKGITVENVSFSYPGAENKCVDSVSIDIKAGETIAIVGENGAGKTTLVRLLMGLYKPDEGKISLMGIETGKANAASVFGSISGVFQRYQRYQLTLEENIKISDCVSKNAIEKAAEQAGVDITGESFPEGVKTMLSREFEGVDLSGGEWQRVAIARGLYRFHNVIVLDEPTAAIDPIEESRIYRKFIEISADKTAIIVTHRLGSTKIANRVVVMNKGIIDDIGSHNELLAKNGLYYLAENPGKTRDDFFALKALSDADYLESDRNDYRQTWKNLSINRSGRRKKIIGGACPASVGQSHRGSAAAVSSLRGERLDNTGNRRKKTAVTSGHITTHRVR